MAGITIPDEADRRRFSRAAVRNGTVDELVQPALDQLANVEPAAALLPGDAWRSAIDQGMGAGRRGVGQTHSPRLRRR